MRRTTWIPAIALALSTAPAPAGAVSFSFALSSNYLIIGNGPHNDLGNTVGVGDAFNMNNFELGANKAPVPSTDDFLDGGSSGGPTLEGAVPPLPTNIHEVRQGVTGDGNVAITSPDGVFDLQDVGVYADLGVQCEQSEAHCDVGTSNSFFNDPEMFPNTFDTITMRGTDVNPNHADQSTRMDQPNGAGVTGEVDLSGLLVEIAGVASAIPTLDAVGPIFDTSGNGGVLDSDLTLVLELGLNVIDIETGGADFVLNNANLVIDGPAGAFAAFRLPHDQDFLISNGNILLGDGGIGLNHVLFFSDAENTDQHFNFDNTVLNGVAFWSVGPDGPGTTGGEIVINNAQGCVQLVADKITLNDVRFARCAIIALPEPNSFSLLALGLAGLAAFPSARTHRRLGV